MRGKFLSENHDRISYQRSFSVEFNYFLIIHIHDKHFTIIIINVIIMYNETNSELNNEEGNSLISFSCLNVILEKYE